MSLYYEGDFSNPQVFAFSPPAPPARSPVPDESLTSYWYVVQGVESAGTLDPESLYLAAASGGSFFRYLIRVLAPLPASDTSPSQSDLDFDAAHFYAREGVGSDPGLGLNDLDCGTLLGATSSVISTPYHGLRSQDLRNGVKGFQVGLDPGSLVYQWESSARLGVDDRGSVTFKPLSRSNTKSEDIVMKVAEQEQAALQSEQGGSNPVPLGEVDAFTLVLTILAGASTSLPSTAVSAGSPPASPEATPILERPDAWSVKVSFGEVSLELVEGRPEAVLIVGEEKVAITVNPGAGSRTDMSRGAQTYHLTFIPVWNGMLVSDSPPGSANWVDKVTYVRKNRNASMYNVLDEVVKSYELDQFPRFGDGGAVLPAVLDLGGDDSTTMDTGEELKVTFLRCGGVLLFKPVYFTPSLETHFLYYGDPQGNSTDKLLPVVASPPSAAGVSGTWGVDPLLGSASSLDNPIWDLSQVFVRGDSSGRRPFETWGAMLYSQSVNAGLRNADGVLPDDAIRTDFIRSIEVNRGLDGSTGTVVWDLFDPTSPTGFYPRPAQAIGALRLGVAGGQDTRAGVIFTGIAAGNAESDSPDSNEIEVPLQGREMKLTGSEGGLILLNVPFFDGAYDVDVMQWLCDYGGVPFAPFVADSYRLPAGPISSPVVDFRSGTPVWDAMAEVQGLAATLGFFDRFGVYRYYQVGQVSGVDWEYPATQVISYNDRPDFTQIRNAVGVFGLVSPLAVVSPERLAEILERGFDVSAQPMFVFRRLDTQPYFAWDKMYFYAIPGILTPQGLQLAAQKILYANVRARASGSVTVPGNADIELLDTFNGDWVITQVSHQVDVQQKTWTTSLALELRVQSTGGSSQTSSPLVIGGTEFNGSAGIDFQLT